MLLPFGLVLSSIHCAPQKLKNWAWGVTIIFSSHTAFFMVLQKQRCWQISQHAWQVCQVQIMFYVRSFQRKIKYWSVWWLFSSHALKQSRTCFFNQPMQNAKYLKSWLSVRRGERHQRFAPPHAIKVRAAFCSECETCALAICDAWRPSCSSALQEIWSLEIKIKTDSWKVETNSVLQTSGSQSRSAYWHKRCFLCIQKIKFFHF